MKKNPQSAGLFVRLLAIATLLAIAAGVLFALDRMTFEKVATRLVMPGSVLWAILLAASIVMFRRRQRAAGVLLFLTWSAYSIIANGLISEQLMLSLEAPYISVDPLSEEPFDTIIVLGGGASVGANHRVQGGTSGDRLILAAELYHAGLAHHVICTGRRIAAINTTGLDPGEESREILIGLGVPADQIELLPGRNTSEEMMALGERFDQSDRVGLVTSAWHLRRAVSLANRSGFSPSPLPADFRTGPAESPRPWGFYVLALIPDQDSLSNTSLALKEHLGRLIGR